MPTPLDYAAQICYSSREVLQFTYDQAMAFKDKPGVYVEAGVAAGAQIIAMAYGAPNKIIYAFDSFEGIPLPSNRDDQMPGIAKLSAWEQKALPDPGKQVLESSGVTVVSEINFWINIAAAFQKELKYHDFYGRKVYEVEGLKIRPIVGWFEDSLMVNHGISNIEILRLDGDLYNSTWVCLQHLFPKVIQGGCVIVDDWTLQGCQAACKEYFELIGYEPDYKFLDGTAYFYK